jgi:tRNA A64-2'-O-ribosylphosphate transferase
LKECESDVDITSYLSLLAGQSEHSFSGTTAPVLENSLIRAPLSKIGELEVYVGDWRCATEETYAQFPLIFNCTTENPSFVISSSSDGGRAREGYFLLDIPEGKRGQTRLFEAITLVLARYRPGVKVLIHCQQGIDRSAGIALAILLHFHSAQNSNPKNDTIDDDERQYQISKVDILKQICRLQRYRQCVNPSRATTKQIVRYFVNTSK